MSHARAFTVSILIFTAACTSSSWDPAEGSEDAKLAQGLSGTLLVRESPRAERELAAFALPGGKPRKLVLELEADSFSGPDEEGRIVYDCVHLPNLAANQSSSHEIRLASLDGSAEQILLLETGTLAGRNALALAPKGGQVACAVADRARGTVSLLRFAHGSHEEYRLKSKVVNDLQWLDDGRLAYAGTFAWEDVPFTLRPADPPARFGRRADIDLVCAFDFATRTERPLCPGTRFVSVPSYHAVLVADASGVLAVDAMTGRRVREPRPIPAALPEGPNLIAALDLDRVLYVGRTTRGSEARTYVGDGLVRHPMVTIKIADLASGSFATVVPHVRPPLAAYGR